MTVDHVDPLGDRQKRVEKGRLVVELAAEIRAAWDARCAARGEKPGPAARRLIEVVLAGQEAVQQGSAPFTLGGAPDERTKVKYKLSLTPSEDAAVKAIALTSGFGYGEWIVAAVRAALARSPSFGQAELEALTASNVLLGQIAADLAVLERAASESPDLSELAPFRAQIREHMKAASELMAEGVRRWEIKV